MEQERDCTPGQKAEEEWNAVEQLGVDCPELSVTFEGGRGAQSLGEGHFG